MDNMANNYYQAPTLNLNGTDPDAEYNAWVAAKPQHKRAPSWMDKNVYTPIGDLFDEVKQANKDFTTDNIWKDVLNPAIDRGLGAILPTVIDLAQGTNDVYKTLGNTWAGHSYESGSPRSPLAELTGIKYNTSFDDAFNAAYRDGVEEFNWDGDLIQPKKVNLEKEIQDLGKLKEHWIL